MGIKSASANPPTEPRKITISTARACFQPASARFMGRRNDMDDFDDQPEKKSTQEEQDAEDEKARKRAMKNLVKSWQERLQLISVITTFFATTEAAMLVNTKPGTGEEWENAILKVSNAGFLGSLILHVYASVLSFLGAFLLISYKLKEAKRQEMIVEGLAPADSPVRHSMNNDAERGLPLPQLATHEQNGPGPAEPHVFSANPHIEQVSHFTSRVSSDQLLSRTHALCVLLTALGFVLAIVGIICYSWALQPKPVSVFVTVCLGGSLLGTLVLRA